MTSVKKQQLCDPILDYVWLTDGYAGNGNEESEEVSPNWLSPWASASLGKEVDQWENFVLANPLQTKETLSTCTCKYAKYKEPLKFKKVGQKNYSILTKQLHIT